MDPKTAFAMLLGAQGLPPEVTELLFDKIEDLNELLLSGIDRNRAVALKAKLDAWTMLVGGDETLRTLAPKLMEEIRTYFGSEDEPKGTDA